MSQEHNASILEFPKNKIVRQTETLNSERLEKVKAKSLENFSQTVVEDVTENILGHFEHYGIDTQSEVLQKDFMFLTSVVQSFVNRALEMEHPLHEFIDKNIQLKPVPPEELEELIDK